MSSVKFKRFPDRASVKELVRAAEEGGRDGEKARLAKIVVKGRVRRAMYGEAGESTTD